LGVEINPALITFKPHGNEEEVSIGETEKCVQRFGQKNCRWENNIEIDPKESMGNA
jgi:hypothetical protein